MGFGVLAPWGRGWDSLLPDGRRLTWMMHVEVHVANTNKRWTEVTPCSLVSRGSRGQEQLSCMRTRTQRSWEQSGPRPSGE